MVVVRGQHQGSLADAGRRIQVGARGDEYLDRAKVTISGCEEQRGQSTLVDPAKSGPGSVRLERVIGNSRQSTALRVASGETDELATELRASVDIGPRVDQQTHDLVLLLSDRPVQRCLFAAAALGVDVCAGGDECLDH